MPDYPNGPTAFRRLIRELHVANQTQTLRHFRNEFTIIDLSAGILLDLRLIARDMESASEDVFWPQINPADRIPCPNLLGRSVLTALLDAITAARNLASAGLDNPARIVIRTIQELSDFSVCLFGDRHFFDEFRQCPSKKEDHNESDYMQWARLLKPAKLRSKASSVRIRIGLPEDVDAEISAYRKKNYQFLSKFAHLDFEGLTCGNLQLLKDDRVVENFLGGTGLPEKSTLQLLVFEAWVAVITVAKLLFKDHLWRMRLSEQQVKTFDRLNTLNKAYIIYRKKSVAGSQG